MRYVIGVAWLQFKMWLASLRAPRLSDPFRDDDIPTTLRKIAALRDRNG